MIIIPINGACISLTLRSMKDMSEITLSAYIIFSLFIIYAPSVALVYGFDYLDGFEYIDWSICLLLGFTSSYMHIARSLSIKYEEPARVAVLNYFQPIMQLVLDIMFLKSDFSSS